MNQPPLPRPLSPLLALFAFSISLQMGPLKTQAQDVFSGLPIMNRKFQVNIDEYGYSDSILDRRRGYKNREYLSGEWAAAIKYSGGHLSAVTRWLTPRFVFPDYATMGPHYAVQTPFHFSTPPTNSSGFPVYQVIITNADLRITIVYEMLDLGTNQAGQLPIGTVAKSAGGAGAFIMSGRYVFKQTYRIMNVSGNTLTGVAFFQFIHGLHSQWGVHDNRNYAGGLPGYRNTIMLQGNSRSLNSKTLETAEHLDTIAFTSSSPVWSFEMGRFGGVAYGDNHQTGKPSQGVHLSVESGMLSNTDSVAQLADTWVAGAACWWPGTILANETKTLDFVMSIHTDSTIVRPPLDLSIRRAQRMGNQFMIDFQESTSNPDVGYALLKSTDPTLPSEQWQNMGLSYQINVPQLGWNRFTAPFSLSDTKSYYQIQAAVFE